MLPLPLTEDDKILIIAPHPDDESIGTGGILMAYSAQCSVYVMTDGSLGQGDCSPKECRNIRHQEFIDAMNYAGIKDYHFFDFPDGMLMNHTNCLEDVNLEIFTKIFVTGTKDGHADHSAAFLCVKNALVFQKNITSEVYLYEVHNHLLAPSHYINITKFIGQKKKLIRFHRSQLAKVPYDKLAEITAEFRGIQLRSPNMLAEAYEKCNISCDDDCYLINTERNLQKFKSFYHVLTKWLYSDIDIADYLRKSGINSCVIYGYAEIGKILFKKLSSSKMNVLYVLDKNATASDDIKIFYPQKNLEIPDAVLVTAISSFNEIKTDLEQLGYRKILSLQDVINEL